MSKISIRVDHISKEYRIGALRNRHDTLRDQLAAGVRGLFGRPDARGKENSLFWALKDVSFELEQGDVLGVIGRNGAGKSTLLKILSRITSPTSGHAVLSGRVASLLEVGTGFHPELTGRENVYLNGALLGMRKFEIDRNLDQIVEFSGVEKFIDTPVKRYSSGMYIRLAFAVAAHLSSEILIVDEVLAVGDAAFQSKCLGKMSDISRTGRIVVFVSHQLGSVARLCSRAIHLESGRIVDDGSPRGVISAYLGDLDQTQDRVGYRDLRPIGRRIGNGELRFASIRTLNMKGRTTSTFAYGEPFTLRVEIESNQAIDGPLVGFGFVASDGTTVLGSESFADMKGLRIQRGLNVIECDINPNVLVPGKYHISLGANLRVGNVELDYVEEVMVLEIAHTEHSTDAQLPANLIGYVHVPYRWRGVSPTAPSPDHGMSEIAVSTEGGDGSAES